MKNNLFEKKTYTSFDKNYSAKIYIKKPDKYREIENNSLSSSNLITMGSAYSYTAASFKKNSLSLSFDKFNRVIDFDKIKKTITVEAGMKIFDFLNFTLERSLWIPQIPGYPFISIGGSVAANAHGKSCSFHGSIRNLIKKITLFHRNHGWLNLSENENREIFDLTIGGYGLTGTIVDVTFDLIDFKGFNFHTLIEKTDSSLDTITKIKNNTNTENYIYSWNRADNKNNFGKGFIFQNKINSETKISKINKIVFTIPKQLSLINLWNSYTINVFNSIFYNYHKFIKNKKYDESFKNVIFPFSGKEKYFDMFGKKGFIESQILVPNSNIEEFLEEFKSLFDVHKPTITLYSIKKMSGEEKYLRFEGNKICLTFDFVNNKKNIEFMNLLDNLCIKYKAIPSIIKDSRLSETTINKCYQFADNFRNDLKKFDPKRIYKSELSDRLNI
jgi:decaprenylphospho-beta-D-ribofuranose 2-oxidase